MLACGCLGLGAAVAIPALASGASPVPPSVTSAAATNVGASGATTNGTVNPNGEQTSYAVQWGPTNGYGHETNLSSAGSGSSAQNITASLSGLESGSTYHFRVIALNLAGTSVGSDESFTTTGTAPAPSAAPVATTSAATNVNESSATLNGTEDPSGQATQYYFEYGPTANYGFETGPESAAAGSAAAPVTATLSRLLPATTYHYRLVAVNAGGTALGADGTFTTAATPQSRVSFIGHEGFVSPGDVIGVEAACLGGAQACTGHVSMTVAGTNTVIGQRNFTIAANTGGFENMKITQTGVTDLQKNGVFHLLRVDVNVTTSTGQSSTENMGLAQWVWHES
jgi:hypothetical protein